jgi:hypothetical protein
MNWRRQGFIKKGERIQAVMVNDEFVEAVKRQLSDMIMYGYSARAPGGAVLIVPYRPKLP